MGIFLVDYYKEIRMKVFLVATFAIVGVFVVPSSRNSCPSLEEIGQWFENEFNTPIPDGIIDCVHNGENCPFSDFGDFQVTFVKYTNTITKMDGLNQQPASRFLFPMMTLLRLF